MVNLFEILQNAQGGQAFDNLSKQFGLSAQQTQAAVEALLPAFSMGLKRQAADPMGLSALFGVMNGGAHRSVFEDAMAAFGQNTASQGNDVLGALFGSKEVSRAIAAQAEAMSGVGAAVLKQMMPVLASLIAGGIAKSATQPGLQDVFSQMMGAMLGGAAAAPTVQPSTVQPNENGGGLLGALLGSILAQGNFQTGAASPPPPPPPPPPAASNPADILGQMFESGLKVQKTQFDQMQSIFETFLGPKK